MKCAWCEDDFKTPPIWGPSNRSDHAFCDEDCKDLFMRRKMTALRPIPIPVEGPTNPGPRDPYEGLQNRPSHHSRKMDEIEKEKE